MRSARASGLTGALERGLIARVSRLIDRHLVDDRLAKVVGESGQVDRNRAVAKAADELPAERFEVPRSPEDPLEPALLAGAVDGADLELAQNDVERVRCDARKEARAPAGGRHHVIAKKVANA